MRRRVGGLLVVGALTVFAAGCSNGGDTASAVEGISEERTSTTTIPPAQSLEPTTTIPVELLPPQSMQRDDKPPAKRSWEGQRFDFGAVERVEKTGDAWTVVFDRKQLNDGHGARTGPTLTEEPVVIGDDPDVTITNVNSRLRTFGMRDDAEILRLSPTWSCQQPMPVWDAMTTSELAVAGPGEGQQQDSLTFDDQGQVVRIRLSRAC